MKDRNDQIKNSGEMPDVSHPNVKDGYGGKWVCWQCLLSDDREFHRHKDDLPQWVGDFSTYIDEQSEFNLSLRYALNKVFMDAAGSDHPPLISRRVISRAIRIQEEIFKREAFLRAYDAKEHPNNPALDEEEVTEAKVEDLNAMGDRWSRHLEEYDSRCILYAMRSIFDYLNPNSPVKPNTLEQDLASDRYLSLDDRERQWVVYDFLNYLEDSEINQNHDYGLTALFFDIANTGGPQLVSEKAISEAIEWRNKAGRKAAIDEVEDLLRDFNSFLPRDLLVAMRVIFAFLNPDSAVNASAPPNSMKTPKKRAKKHGKNE